MAAFMVRASDLESLVPATNRAGLGAWLPWPGAPRYTKGGEEWVCPGNGDNDISEADVSRLITEAAKDGIEIVRVAYPFIYPDGEGFAPVQGVE